MSDPIAEAAASMGAAPSSTEPVVVQAAVEQPVSGVIEPAIAPVTGNVLVNETPAVSAPVLEVGTAAPGESSNTGAASAEPAAPTPTPMVDAAAELPRESHLMLLEHKLGIVRAKLVNAERVSLDEFEGILVHIRAVL